MSGSSLLFAWEPIPWLFIDILSPGLLWLTLALPIILALLVHYIDQKLNHATDNIYYFCSAFFFVSNEQPKHTHSKIIFFSFCFFVLVFMSFYTGILTDEFFFYKNFNGITSSEDVYNEKINVYDPYKYMLLASGGTLLFLFQIFER